MPAHLLAFNSTLAAVAGYQQVSAIADAMVPRTNGNLEYQIPGQWDLAGAYAGGAANVRARFQSPSLTLRGNPQIVSISGTHLPAVDPNFMDLTNYPLSLAKEEPLRADMESNSATAVSVLAWVYDPKEMEFKIEYPDMRWVRATVSVTTVIQAWATGTIVFDEPMEGGTYAVYGMQAFFATAIAARLIIPGQVQRPGCLGQATAISRSAPIFWGGLGLWGKFDTFSLPQLEVLDTAAAAVSYTIWLLLAKTSSALRR